MNKLVLIFACLALSGCVSRREYFKRESAWAATWIAQSDFDKDTAKYILELKNRVKKLEESRNPFSGIYVSTTPVDHWEGLTKEYSWPYKEQEPPWEESPIYFSSTPYTLIISTAPNCKDEVITTDPPTYIHCEEKKKP